MKLAYSFLLLVLFFSCNKKNKIPDGILKPAKMQLVLWDVLKANALAEEIAKKDSTTKIQKESVRLQSQVFSIHKISKDDFYKSYNFYAKHTELLLALLDSTIANAMRKNYNSGVKHPFKLGDTTNFLK